jgi:ubiquinone/menaquinone biosynthesis C-methylase UbiE
MSATENQPDWQRIAEKFDLWLPQIAPVGEALLTVLDARSGDKVIDLASGTGEPALSLARRLPGVQITGVDAAESMVRVAQSKVAADGLPNITFQCMPAEALDFADNAFDRALCRFGVMLFQDPLKGLSEMRRVLKPGGRFALAVWSTPETMPSLHWAFRVFAPRLPEDKHPPLIKVTSLGGPGVLEDLIYRAGFNDFNIETRTVEYAFPSFDAYWDTVEATDILKMQYDALPPGERDNIRNEIGQLAREFAGEHGLRVPHNYLLAWGNKPV